MSTPLPPLIPVAPRSNGSYVSSGSAGGVQKEITRTATTNGRHSKNRARDSGTSKRKRKVVVAPQWSKKSTPLYIVIASIIMGLAYTNINRLFWLEKTEGATSAFYDQFFGAPSLVEESFDSTRQNGLQKSHRRDFHVYWLTEIGDKRSPRQDRMEKALRTLRLQSNETKSLVAQGLVTTIPWWTVEQVKAIYRPLNESKTNPKRLKLTNNVTLKYAQDNPKRPTSYSYDDAARLVTHLTALGEAYEEGYEQVLIVDDDAILIQSFFDHRNDYMQLAPPDWTVLQWATNNLATLEQTFPLPEPWISWLPDLWGLHAYTINRNGLEAIRKRLVRVRRINLQDTAREYFYTVDDGFNNILLADELLFAVPNQHAYTSTFPWVVSDEIRNSLDWKTPFGVPFAQSPPNLSLPEKKFEMQKRSESLLVFMNIRFVTSKRMGLEIDRTLSDLESVCALHSKCDWIIHAVFTHDYLLTRFQEQYESLLPSNIILFKKTVGNERFNKFGLLAEHLSNMSSYDLVLLKDNDQRLTGFPWYSFLEHKGDSFVAGPLRQAPDESFVRTKIWDKSQHYKLHDAQAWKMKNFAPWSTKLFVNISVIEVPFLEMYFNVFDGKYAEWFFSQVLTKNFTEQDSCWGPDFLWCPGAVDYGKLIGKEQRMGCALVPFVSVHEDTRQIVKDGEAFNLRGYAAVENLKNSNPTFKRWYNTAYKYARGVIAWRQLDAIAKHCRTRLLRLLSKAAEQTIDFRACIDAGMARNTIV